MTNLEHIRSLAAHGAQLRNTDDGSLTPLTEVFYRRAVEACRAGGCNAITYDLVLPGIGEEMGLCVWRDGHVDSGSMRSICDCLAAR